jgi:hypothetical protein
MKMLGYYLPAGHIHFHIISNPSIAIVLPPDFIKYGQLKMHH